MLSVTQSDLGSIRELGQYGPMKQPEQVGIDHIKESHEGVVIEKNQYYNADPSGLRTGNGPGPDYFSTLEQVSRDAEAVLDMVNCFDCFIVLEFCLE